MNGAAVIAVSATRRRVLGLVLGAAGTSARGAVAAAPGLEVWQDLARNRRVPVRLRLPPGGEPAPLVILSHGLGGSRDGLGYLGAALAEAGFVALHAQHVGTDSTIWRGTSDIRLAMAAAVLDVRRAVDRLHDIAFLLGEAARRPGLAERIAGQRIAIAGHSYGAWTVTAMLGERLPGGALVDQAVGLALPDPRLAAGIALSPVPPLGLPPALAYARVRAPILHVTGTLDRGVIEAATPQDRLIPFEHIAAPGVLAVLDGAGHGAFADEPDAGPRWNDPQFHARTAALAVLFLRAVLRGDAAADAVLRRAAPLAPADRLTFKGRLV